MCLKLNRQRREFPSKCVSMAQMTTSLFFDHTFKQQVKVTLRQLCQNDSLTLTRLLRFLGSSSCNRDSISPVCCLIWTVRDWTDSSRFLTVLHVLSSSFCRSFDATTINSIRPRTLAISSYKQGQMSCCNTLTLYCPRVTYRFYSV